MDHLQDINVLEKYAKSAEFILPQISQKLKDTFEKRILNAEPENYVLDFIQTTQSSLNMMMVSQEPTLEDLICVCTYIALSTEPVDSAIRTYKETHRTNKRSLMRYINEEMDSSMELSPRNPQLLKKYAESTAFLSSDAKSVEDIMKEKYEDMEKWRLDFSLPITDFEFIKQKTPKTIANCFINDITLESLLIIKEQFGGSIDGFNTKIPTQLSDPTYFSYKNKKLDFIPQLVENEIYLFNTYYFENEETTSDVTTSFSTEKQVPSSFNNPNALPGFLKKYNIDLTHPTLDLKDKDIATYLFNQLNGDNLANVHIKVYYIDLIRSVYGVQQPKAKHYDDLYERLEKLKKYNQKITIRSKNTGEIIESSTLGLLNYLHQSKKERFFFFSPSDQMVKTYIERKYFSILTDTYRIVESPQTRTIMTMLQQLRLAEHVKGSTSTTLVLNFFRNYLKLDKITNTALTKELIKHFEYLKENDIIISKYRFMNKNSSVMIEFCPLDSKELLAYEFDTKALPSKDDIVEGDAYILSDN